jgi:K+-transporting ATPase ATPase C chain
MFFASASGVDPHISPISALFQVERIVKTRKFNKAKKEKVIELIDSLTEKPQFGFLGNEVVNVLLLNIELDKLD